MRSKCIPVVGLLVLFLVFFMKISELFGYSKTASRLHALINEDTPYNVIPRKMMGRLLQTVQSDAFPYDQVITNASLHPNVSTQNKPDNITADFSADNKIFKCTFTTTHGARLCRPALNNMVTKICELVPEDVRWKLTKSLESLSAENGINAIRSHQNDVSRERFISALSSGNGREYRFWIATLFSHDVVSILAAVMATVGCTLAFFFLILPWAASCKLKILRRRKPPKSILKTSEQYSPGTKETKVAGGGKKVQFTVVNEFQEPNVDLDEHNDNKNIPILPSESEICRYRHHLFGCITPRTMKWMWLICGFISFAFLTVSFGLSLKTALNRGKQVRINLQMAKCIGASQAYSALFNEHPTNEFPFLGFEKLTKVYEDVQAALPLYKKWTTTRDEARILSEAASLIMSPLRTTDYLLNRQPYYWNDVPVHGLNHRPVAALAFPLIASEREMAANMGRVVEHANNTDSKEKLLMIGLETVERLMKRSMNIMHGISSSISVMFHHPYVGFNRDSSKHFMVAISSFAWLSFLPFLSLIIVWIIQSVSSYSKIGQDDDVDQEETTETTEPKIRSKNEKSCRLFMLTMGFLSLLCGEVLFLLIVVVSITSRGLRDACGYIADEILSNGNFGALSSQRLDLTQLGSACFAEDATGDILEAAASILEFDHNLPHTSGLAEEQSAKWRPHYAKGLKFILDLEDYLFSNLSSSSMPENSSKVKILPEREQLMAMAHVGLVISASGTGDPELPITSLDLSDVTIDCFEDQSSRLLCAAISSEHPSLVARDKIVVQGIWSTLNQLETMMPDDCRLQLCLGGERGNCYEEVHDEDHTGWVPADEEADVLNDELPREDPQQILKTTKLEISPKTIRYVDLSQEVLKKRTTMHLTAEGAAAAECFERTNPALHQKWAKMIQEVAMKSMILSEPVRFVGKNTAGLKNVERLRPDEIFPDTCPIRQHCPLFVTLQQHTGMLPGTTTDFSGNKRSLQYTLGDYRAWSTQLIDTLRNIPDELSYEEALELMKELSFTNSFIQPLRAFLDFIHQQINCTQLRKSTIHASYAVCHQTLSQFEQLRLPFCILALFDYVTFAYIFALWWKKD